MSDEATLTLLWKCPDCGDTISDKDSLSSDIASDGTMVIERLCPECGVDLEVMSDLEQAGAKRARAKAAIAELQCLNYCSMSDEDLLEAADAIGGQHRAATNEARKRSLLDDYGHTIETDGVHWFVRCTHAANDPDWFGRSEATEEIVDESCWVRGWNCNPSIDNPWSDEWGEALRHAINMNGQATITAALITIEPVLYTAFVISSVVAPSGTDIAADHSLETDGATWSIACQHDDSQERFLHDGNCIAQIADPRVIWSEYSIRHPDMPKRFSLGSIGIAWDGDEPTIERFAPKVRFLTGDEIDQVTGK